MIINKFGQFNLVQMPDSLCIDNALAIQEELLKTLDAGRDNEWVLDLSPLSQIDQTGLGVLVYLTTLARSYGARVLLYAPNELVMTTLGTTGLNGFFPIIEDEDDLVSRLPD